MTTTDELAEEYRTRPGTPMIGVYSVNQMDDFYTALARWENRANWHHERPDLVAAPDHPTLPPW